MAVAAGNPLNLSNDDLCGKNIAVTKGSNAQLKHLPNISEWTCDPKGKPAINGVTLPNVQEALTQLASKRIDGVLYDTPALVVGREAAAERLRRPRPRRWNAHRAHRAIGLKKGSPLTPALQAAVQSVLDSPEYKKSLDQLGPRARGHHRSQAQLAGTPCSN